MRGWWLVLLVGCAKAGPEGDDSDAPDTDTVSVDTFRGDAGECLAEPTPRECRGCCYDLRPGLQPSVLTALLAGCACVQGNAPCNEACQEEGCSDAPHTDACIDCLVEVLRTGTDRCLDVGWDLCDTEVPGRCVPIRTCTAGCD